VAKNVTAQSTKHKGDAPLKTW